MDKLLLIIRHEFIGLIRQKGFIIITLLFPLLSLGALGAYQAIQNVATEGTTQQIPKIGYVDYSGGFDDTSQVTGIQLIKYNSDPEAKESLIDGAIDEYFVIRSDYIATGRIDRFTLKREVEMSGTVSYQIKEFLTLNLFENRLSGDLLERTKLPAWFNTTRLDVSGAVSGEQGGVVSVFLIPYIFTILFWISLLSAAFTLIEGLGDEKENRVMEILLSSVSAEQLMMGKILGLGAAGLCQITFWFVSGFLVAGMASSAIGGMFTSLEIPARLIVFGLVYFILGYLMFGVMFSIIGALVPRYRDGQQLSFFIIMPAAVPLVLIYFMVDNVNHPLTIFFTLFPITSPVASIIRLGVSTIPAWQIAVSWSIMILFIAAVFMLGTKIFRTYLLMYGKRPSFRDIFRNLRQA